MYGYYYHAGKSWEDVKLWEATKDNPQENINVESFLTQDNYWNIGSFMELAKEMQLVLKADYSYPIILDEEYKLVDGAHRLVHAYIDGKTHIKGVIIRNDQWPEPDYDENKECQNTWKPSDEQMKALNYVVNLMASSESPTENDYYYNLFKDMRTQLKKLKE
jgi:hypothetical protein